MSRFCPICLVFVPNKRNFTVRWPVFKGWTNCNLFPGRLGVSEKSDVLPPASLLFGQNSKSLYYPIQRLTTIQLLPFGGLLPLIRKLPFGGTQSNRISINLSLFSTQKHRMASAQPSPSSSSTSAAISTPTNDFCLVCASSTVRSPSDRLVVLEATSVPQRLVVHQFCLDHHNRVFKRAANTSKLPGGYLINHGTDPRRPPLWETTTPAKSG